MKCLAWKTLYANNLSDVVRLIKETEGVDAEHLSLIDILASYLLTNYKAQLIPLMYENRSMPKLDVYLYFAYNFGWTPEEVDKLPADIVSYFLAKKISRL